jgi:hypothetical protein
MTLALAARTLAVCLAAAGSAPDAGAPPADARRAPPKNPPPAVVIVPLLGAVLLPITLPTSAPRKRAPAPEPRPDDPAGSAAPVPGRTSP